MRPIIYLLLIVLCTYSVSAQADSAANSDALLSKAISNYEEGNFSEALRLYESLLATQESPELFHNLSLAYFNNGELGKAILYMERALRLDPLDEDINKNLNLLYENVESDVQDLPPFFILAWSNAVARWMQPGIWTFFHLLLLVAAIALVYLYLIKNYDLGLHFYYIRGLIIGLFVFSLITLALAYNAHRLQIDDTYAIVTQDDTPIRAGAESNSQEIGQLKEGLKVEIQDEIADFFKVRLGDYTEGWLEKVSVTRI